jgi:hypothetical protein
MNRQPIYPVHDADLRRSEDTMRRAAKRAHAVARQTGTQLVYCYHGEVLRISPDEQVAIEAAWAGEAGRRIQAYDKGSATVYSVKEPHGDEENKS